MDKVLFTETSDVLRAMEKNQEIKDEIIRGELGDSDEEDGSVEIGGESSQSEDFGGEDFGAREETDEEEKIEFEEEEEEEKPLKEDLVKKKKEGGAEALGHDSPRKTRKEVASEKDEEAIEAKGATIQFAEYGDIDYETKVMFVNNQKVSIVRQKQD